MSDAARGRPFAAGLYYIIKAQTQAPTRFSPGGLQLVEIGRPEADPTTFSVFVAKPDI